MLCDRKRARADHLGSPTSLGYCYAGASLQHSRMTVNGTKDPLAGAGVSVRKAVKRSIFGILRSFRGKLIGLPRGCSRPVARAIALRYARSRSKPAYSAKRNPERKETMN